MLRQRFTSIFRQVLSSGSTVSQPIRCYVAPAVASDEAESGNTSMNILPSRNFIKTHVRGVRNRERLASLVAEIELFRDFFGVDSLQHFDDGNWSIFYNMIDPEERSSFLISLFQEARLQESGQSIPEEGNLKISEINQQKLDAGEMTYAPGFHQYIELRGQDFRRQIDRMYGSRLLSAKRGGADIGLTVDCRFLPEFSYQIQHSYIKQLQDLYDHNWMSRTPFHLSLANMKPDRQLAELLKRHLYFLHGPPRVQEDAETFVPHPMVPQVTTRGLRDTVTENGKDSVLYVSWRSTRLMPEVPPENLKTVVICASTDYQPWSSAISAAKSDGLPTYRIPFEKYMRFTGSKKILPLRTVGAILQDWTNGSDWETAIGKNTQGRGIKGEERARRAEEREKVEMFKMAVKDLSIVRRKEEDKQMKNNWNPVIPRDEREGEKSFSKNQRPQPQKAASSVRHHRYSREERNARRAAGGSM